MKKGSVILLEFPERGEKVIVQVKKIMNYGVIASLLEYEGLEGFVHISHVASGWIKNIRNFVKENQTRVAEVLSVDREKNQLDLSFKKVSEQAEHEKLEQWKQFKRTKKLIEIIAEKQKKNFDIAWQQVAEPLIEEYGSLMKAFKEISLKGKLAAEKVPKDWQDVLLEVVEKNIVLPQKTIKTILTIKSFEPNGVELIKKVLSKGEKVLEGKDARIYYKGSGSYAVEITAPEYKQAEAILKNFQETVLGLMQKENLQGDLKREK